MLLLRRKVLQKIIITVKPSETAQRIEVQLCDVSAWHALLGIEASDAVRILREEVEDREEVA